MIPGEACRGRSKSSIRLHAVGLALAWVVLLLSQVWTGAADPFPGALPGVEIGGNLPRSFEPSGVVWHSRLARLVVVDDGGRVAILKPDGSGVRILTVRGDLEGVCIADPQGDFIYVGLENPPQIKEVHLRTGRVTRVFRLLDPLPDGRGLEALTFVPLSDHPEGGRFYTGIQSDGSIRIFDLPIRTSATRTDVTPAGSFVPVAGRSDLSGLHYDADTKTLYAIYDQFDLLRAMKLDGTPLGEWVLPGDGQEGVALAGSDLFVAEDSGALLRYRLDAS